MIVQGQLEAEARAGARFLYPATLDGQGVPCTCSPLTNAARLRADGGGSSLFDDASVSLRTSLFTNNAGVVSRPREQQQCKLKVGRNEPWRAMKIESVTIPPPGVVFMLNLNSLHENA